MTEDIVVPRRVYRRIPGLSGYGISRDGEVWAETRPHRPGRVLSTHSDARGYRRVTIEGTARLVHRLLLSAFVRPPTEYEVGRHLDDDPTNNALENLAWGTYGDNAADMRRNGNGRTGRPRKLTDEQCAGIRSARAAGSTMATIAADFGVSVSLVSRIISGDRRKRA